MKYGPYQTAIALAMSPAANVQATTLPPTLGVVDMFMHSILH